MKGWVSGTIRMDRITNFFLKRLTISRYFLRGIIWLAFSQSPQTPHYSWGYSWTLPAPPYKTHSNPTSPQHNSSQNQPPALPQPAATSRSTYWGTNSWTNPTPWNTPVWSSAGQWTSSWWTRSSRGCNTRMSRTGPGTIGSRGRVWWIARWFSGSGLRPGAWNDAGMFVCASGRRICACSRRRLWRRWIPGSAWRRCLVSAGRRSRTPCPRC